MAANLSQNGQRPVTWTDITSLVCSEITGVTTQLRADARASVSSYMGSSATIPRLQRNFKKARDVALHYGPGHDCMEYLEPFLDTIRCEETTGVVTAPEVDLSPMMMFYQPITLEQLVQTVLSVGEYQTFSMMMRMKVRQLQMVRKLRAERRKELKHKRARRALLRELADDGEEEAVTSGRRLEAALERLWAELAERVAELTPHRADLREAVGQRCASRMLTAWLDAGDRLLDRELDEEEEEARATEGDGGSGGSGGGNTVTTTGNTGWFVGNGWGGGALGEGEDPAGSPAEGAAGQRRAVLKWIRFVFGRLAALCSWGQSVQVRARQAALEVPWKPLSGDGSTGGDDEPATSLPATLLQVRSSSLSLLPYIAPFLLVLLLN